MKTVVSTSMVAHLWANQSQTSATNNTGNFYFQGRVLYCYGYALAALTETPSGNLAVLIRPDAYTKRGWAPNYGNLISAALHGHRHQLFEVPYVTTRSQSPDHAYNLMALIEDATKEANVLAKPHIHSWSIDNNTPNETPLEIAQSHLDAIPILFDTAYGYAKAFNLPGISPTLITTLQANICKAFASYYTPKRIAARTKAQAKRLAVLEDRQNAYARWQSGTGPRPKPSLFTRHSTERQTIEHAIYVEEEANDITEWIAGKHNMLHWHTTHSPLLRLKPSDPAVVQTSLGAEVPLLHAKRIFACVRKCRHRHVSWEPNGHKLPIGSFTVTHIEADGGFTAGCHTFQWQEIERFAKSIGIGELEPPT